ncbi:protein of unknown function [Rhodovastum atsumiense]|nr:protein of unknown function [Rhodovastum atsumiense]
MRSTRWQSTARVLVPFRPGSAQTGRKRSAVVTAWKLPVEILCRQRISGNACRLRVCRTPRARHAEMRLIRFASDGTPRSRGFTCRTGTNPRLSVSGVSTIPVMLQPLTSVWRP